MFMYALIGGVLLLILILFNCLLQQVQHQQTATKEMLRVLMVRRHPRSPPQEVMHAWLSVIQKATA